jgi:hypothetical protein
MSGGLVFKSSGTLGWLGNCQEYTVLSCSEAEIHATSATSMKVVNYRSLYRSLSALGENLTDIHAPTVFYNDNEVCVYGGHTI